MDQLAAMRFNVDARAVYDVKTHADLINSGKYADLHATGRCLCTVSHCTVSLMVSNNHLIIYI